MKPRLSRRTMLRGAGLGSIAIGLPWLEAMLDDNGDVLRQAGAQSIRQPNLAIIFVPNGIHEGNFWPQNEGTNYTLSRCLEPLAAHKSDFLLLQNLFNQGADRWLEVDNDAHSRGHVAFITNGGPQPNRVSEFASVDQIAAQQLNATTAFKTLPLALGGSGGPTYDNNISWKSAGVIEPAERDPIVLFNKMFGAGGSSAPADYRRSVFDYVLADLTRLQGQVSVNDRARLEEHATSIRDLEAQLQGAQQASSSCSSPLPPDPRFGGQPPEYDNGNGAYSNDRVRVIMQLQVLAFACDMTRISTFMMGSRSNKRNFPWLGIEDGDGHHGISHNSSAAGYEMQTKIVIDELQQLAYLLDLMKAQQQGNQNMLYNSVVLWASECGHGEGHDYHRIPTVLAGHAGGLLKPGKHIRYPQDSSWGDLMVSVLNALGVNTNRFGAYGGGPLPGLT
jgi:hypothetical protein